MRLWLARDSAPGLQAEAETRALTKALADASSDRARAAATEAAAVAAASGSEARAAAAEAQLGEARRAAETAARVNAVLMRRKQAMEWSLLEAQARAGCQTPKRPGLPERLLLSACAPQVELDALRTAAGLPARAIEVAAADEPADLVSRALTGLEPVSASSATQPPGEPLPTREPLQTLHALPESPRGGASDMDLEALRASWSSAEDRAGVPSGSRRLRAAAVDICYAPDIYNRSFGGGSPLFGEAAIGLDAGRPAPRPLPELPAAMTEDF